MTVRQAHYGAVGELWEYVADLDSTLVLGLKEPAARAPPGLSSQLPCRPRAVPVTAEIHGWMNRRPFILEEARGEPPEEVQGQVVHVLGVAPDHPESPASALAGADRAVVVWWGYDAACIPMMWDRSALHRARGEEPVPRRPPRRGELGGRASHHR